MGVRKFTFHTDIRKMSNTIKLHEDHWCIHVIFVERSPGRRCRSQSESHQTLDIRSEAKWEPGRTRNPKNRESDRVRSYTEAFMLMIARVMVVIMIRCVKRWMG